MSSISIKKIEIAEVETLQLLLENFVSLTNYRIGMYQKCSDEHISNLLILEVSRKLYFSLRNKIERTSKNKNLVSINLSITDAIVLLKCCTDKLNNCNDYEKYVQNKFKDLIFKEIINIS
ncbi:hypothetical protein FLCU109888_11465 [Flavobacterium cucumis]|uniref:Uncharacterized protein n=1 Tax=Flavobacterium cucumis TaxID=416016 RepID=A0A1M7ZVF8_9FLAO|nr:hypothetical protein [Flavobacterium cucumis]SHO72869.1 hypothetical protein SAMN05443547_1213 [Flavobacterium cucumis]